MVKQESQKLPENVWDRLEILRKDPAFVRAAKEFIRLTSQ